MNGPPPPDTNYGPIYLGVIGVFTVLATGLCGARMISRCRPKVNLRVDDWLILIATILSVAIFFISIPMVVYGWGHHSAYIAFSRQINVFKCSFGIQVIWILAVALVRLSIAVSLLRLSPERIWKYTLWTIFAVQVIIYLGHVLFQFFNCKPLRASWEPVYDIRCWDRKYVLIFGWVANSILVLIDVLLAVMPIHLIRTLHRSRREKILISCLMALGLLAAAIAAYRMSITNSTFAGDLLSSTVMMSMWSELEVLLGIMAACSAPLKAPAERLLKRMGLLASRMEMTRPSFVLSLQDREPSRSSETDRLDSAHTGGESIEKLKTGNRGVSTVEIERGVP
ncbi:hypothetical protein BDV96DRAFT_492371 [Lophiotrema nucula]|uniref:Rhodopsin domain-containing protein n=1 Tax=Lophiotrema nucula TaxID=690887 RepID=A0A6A5Z943_9PLEO|nr:hypothetical protein BDV96DRAFT_492371 [Lophiotrema nucula]